MSRQMTLADGDYFELPWGRAEWHNNELHLVSSVNDPAGISFRGANGCKVSWKDSAGNEKALLQLRQKANGDGEYYLGAYSEAEFQRTHNLDRAMIEVATISPGGIEFRVPVKFSAGGGVVTDTMWAPSGLYFTQQQADGNFVTYRALAPFDKANAQPVWSAWGGLIQ
jgi:hypothetical protein